MFEKLAEKNDVRHSLASMAQYLSTCFMISTTENEYLVNIEKGVVKNVEQGPFVMPSYVFKLAMLRRKVLKFEGDLHPLMSHLLYFKLLLASLRPVENKNEN